MFRKVLLPALAIALLSGCATDYTYRNGSGDYYYGRPQVEYRYIGGYGAYGGFGYGSGYGGYGFGSRYGYGNPVYYYDRFGRLVYGYPYGTYGAPYSGGNYPQRLPRPPYGGGGHDHHDDGGDNVGNDLRRPPWRNIRGIQPGVPEDGAQGHDDNRARRLPSPFMEPGLRPNRVSADPAIGGDEGSPRMGTRARRGVLPSDSTPTSDE